MPVKKTEDPYAVAFVDVVEVNRNAISTKAIPWRRADRDVTTPEKLCDMLNAAYRAGQLNMWHNIKAASGMK